MLNNHTYIGKISYQGQIYKGEHQGIIDRKLWEACQEIMKEGAPMADCSHKLENLAPLKGILRCEHRGGAMTPSYTRNRGRKYHYNTCVHTMKHPESECPIRQVPGGDIEHQVLERLKTMLTAPENHHQRGQGHQDDAQAGHGDLRARILAGGHAWGMPAPDAAPAGERDGLS